ncbi:MAG TPA: HD domain-containing phosphohydrolase [Steroidobacteraceae bacterium]|nr:HD domain-containing phosphohydrolase [Steroidobacteraceae bacterium]
MNEFRALKLAPYVDANEPFTDPRTRGYVEGYIKPLGITSMLDTVVAVSGKHLGLLCLEHVGQPHIWQPDEIAFAARLADKLAVTLALRLARDAEAASRAVARLAHESPNSVMRVRRDGQVLYANPASRDLQALFGAIVGEKANRRCLDIIDECISRGASHEVELAHEERVYSVVASPILAEGYVNIYGTDISARKVAEVALRESRDLLLSVVENVPARVFWKDHDLRFLGCNSLFARDAGLASPQDLIGKNDFQMPWSAQAERYRADDRGVIESGVPKLGIEEPQSSPGGRTVWVRTSKVPLRGPDATHVGVLGMYEDVTDRKAADDELRKSEERFRGYFELGLLGMAITMPDRRFSEVNGKLCEMLGYSRDELISMNWASLTHPEDLADDVARFEQLLSGATEGYSLDKRYIRKDGSTVYCTLSVSCVRRVDLTVEYIVALIQDITERKLAEGTLHGALVATVEAIAATVEARDPYTAGHQRGVAVLAEAIAREMGLSAAVADGVRFGALLHDLGKVQVPAEILSKPTKLSKPEFELIKTHPQAGYDIVKGIKFPWPVAEMILQHHERIDGSGYPQGLKGDQITLGARILAVADVMEAMASHRPYRAGRGIDAALEELQGKRGRWFDPAAVDACVRLFREKGFRLEKNLI